MEGCAHYSSHKLLDIKRIWYILKLGAMPLEASNERGYIIEILMGGLRDV